MNKLKKLNRGWVSQEMLQKMTFNKKKVVSQTYFKIDISKYFFYFYSHFRISEGKVKFYKSLLLSHLSYLSYILMSHSKNYHKHY